MTAGNLNIATYLLEFPLGLKALVDGQGYPLQYDVWGRGVSNPPAKRELSLACPGLALCWLGLKLAFPAVRRRAGAEHSDTATATGWARYRTVCLVSPRLLEKGRIRLLEDDIVHNTGLPGQFHMVRAANILNRCYFDDTTLSRIVGNLGDRLVEGGLLIVCTRTGDNSWRVPNPARKNDGTVFILREGGRFAVAGRLGSGSAVEELVLESRAGSGTPPAHPNL